MGGDRWTKMRNIQTALRSTRPNEDQVVGQPRGWEQLRQDPSPDTNPPQYDRGSAYSPPQRFPSDSGPNNGNGFWANAPPPPPPGLPSSPYNQDYQGRQSQPGFGPQGYAAPATTGPYQYTNSQAYGPNQGYFAPQPPAPYPPQSQAYQQQPMASTGQSPQGGQGASYHHAHPQNTSHPAGSSHSPPLDPRPGSQNPQEPNQSPNFPGQSYHPRSSGGSLSRTVTAPADLHCEHGTERDYCYECQRKYGSSARR